VSKSQYLYKCLNPLFLITISIHYCKVYSPLAAYRFSSCARTWSGSARVSGSGHSFAKGYLRRRGVHRSTAGVVGHLSRIVQGGTTAGVVWTSWGWLKQKTLNLKPGSTEEIGVVDYPNWVVMNSIPYQGICLCLGFLLHLRPLANSAIMSTLTINCRWEDETTMERAGYPPSCAEAKKMKLQTLHIMAGSLASLRKESLECLQMNAFIFYCMCFWLIDCMYFSLVECLYLWMFVCNIWMFVCMNLCIYLSIYLSMEFI